MNLHLRGGVHRGTLREVYGEGTPSCPRLPSWLGWGGHLPVASWYPVSTPVEAITGQGSLFTWCSSRAWGWKAQESTYLGQIMADLVKPIMWHFILVSFHLWIEQTKLKKSVDFLITENICCINFSKSNGPRYIACLATLSNVSCLQKIKNTWHILLFLESKVGLLCLLMTRERKPAAKLQKHISEIKMAAKVMHASYCTLPTKTSRRKSPSLAEFPSWVFQFPNGVPISQSPTQSRNSMLG